MLGLTKENIVCWKENIVQQSHNMHEQQKKKNYFLDLLFLFLEGFDCPGVIVSSTVGSIVGIGVFSAILTSTYF